MFPNICIFCCPWHKLPSPRPIVMHLRPLVSVTMPVENPGGGDHVTRVRLTPWPFLGLTIDN